MALKLFRKVAVIGSGIQEIVRVVNQLQDGLEAHLNPILKDPFLTGQLIEAELILGENTIDHQLGRKPQGYLIVSQDAAGSVYSKQADNDSPHLTLVLQSSAAMAVTLRVF